MNNQVLGTLIVFCIFAFFVFGAIFTHDIAIIISCVILGILTILFTLNSIKFIKKDKGKKIKKDINYGILIGFVFLICMFGISVAVLIKNVTYRKNGIEASATIYDINKKIVTRTEYNEDGSSYQIEETTCDIYIKYIVSEKEYKSKLDSNSCKYKKNDVVKIYYNKDNPESFVSMSLWLPAFATAFTGFGFILFIFSWNKSNKNKKEGKSK